jgi:metal-sulfur cluster biosynthetic enzyme
MQLVTHDDYEQFVKRNKEVQIEEVKVEVGKPWDPADLVRQRTTSMRRKRFGVFQTEATGLLM